jgi:hypothetical protein
MSFTFELDPYFVLDGQIPLVVEDLRLVWNASLSRSRLSSISLPTGLFAGSQTRFFTSLRSCNAMASGPGSIGSTIPEMGALSR